jgi:hypothetical protein
MYKAEFNQRMNDLINEIKKLRPLYFYKREMTDEEVLYLKSEFVRVLKPLRLILVDFVY